MNSQYTPEHYLSYTNKGIMEKKNEFFPPIVGIILHVLAMGGEYNLQLSLISDHECFFGVWEMPQDHWFKEHLQYLLIEIDKTMTVFKTLPINLPLFSVFLSKYPSKVDPI